MLQFFVNGEELDIKDAYNRINALVVDGVGNIFVDCVFGSGEKVFVSKFDWTVNSDNLAYLSPAKFLFMLKSGLVFDDGLTELNEPVLLADAPLGVHLIKINGYEIALEYIDILTENWFWVFMKSNVVVDGVLVGLNTTNSSMCLAKTIMQVFWGEEMLI